MTMSETFATERGFGLPPADHTQAQDQLQKLFPTIARQPMPDGAPTDAVHGSVVGIKEPANKFIVLGDSGGIMNARPQVAVADAMIGQLVNDQEIAFAYHIGDEVYFHGDPANYASQFYEPYAHFNRPIVGVPGNHDGDVSEDDQGNPTGRKPLDTFMANFCDAKPNIPIADPQFEYGRHTQTQPYCYWTLGLENVTIIGLYSNVPSGGYIDAAQLDWFIDQLQKAPKGIPLVVALHHPPYSVDAHHGGSKRIGDALDAAFVRAGRFPQVVVAGHVHDYQRFTRIVEGNTITYIVIGNSGYHNLHPLAKDAQAPMDLHTSSDIQTDYVTFEFGDSRNYGYMIWEADGSVLRGEYYPVTKTGVASVKSVDHFVAGAK